MKKYEGLNWCQIPKEEQDKLLKGARFVNYITGKETTEGVCTVEFANGLETAGELKNGKIFIDDLNLVVDGY